MGTPAHSQKRNKQAIINKLQDILLEAKRGLRAELEDIGKRIADLEREMITVDDWDGDTRDDIWGTIKMFRALAELITARKA